MLPGMHLLTKAEQTKLISIKTRAKAGQFVSTEEKQWTLNIVKRVSAPLPTRLVKTAEKQGFNVKGILVKA